MRISLTDILSRFKQASGPEGHQPLQSGDPEPGYRTEEPQQDAKLADLAQDLESLGALAVPPAAKERTWAAVREEVRSGGAQEPAPVTRRARNHRNTVVRRRRLGWAAGAMAVTVAGVLAVTGIPFADDGGGELADNGGSGTTVVSEETADAGSGPTGGTTTTSGSAHVPEPGTTTSETSETETSETEAPEDTTGSTESTSGSTSTSSTTTQTTSPSNGNTTTSSPSPSTTESGQSILTSEERERSARSAAQHLTLRVVEDDLAGADAVATNGAHQGLVQMASSLHDPHGFLMISVTPGTGNSVRVIVEIKDRRSDGSGGTEEITPRFLYEVRVDENGALVEHIYAAPGG